MNRPERRRWVHDVWPHWENFIKFKKIKRRGPGFYMRTDPRTKAEMVSLIDHMLEDLGENEA